MWPLPRTFSLACHRIVLSANLVGRTRVALAALYGCGASAMPQALPGNSSSPSVMVNVSSRSWPFSGNLRKFTLLIMYESKVEEIALRKHTCVKEMYPNHHIIKRHQQTKQCIKTALANEIWTPKKCRFVGLEYSPRQIIYVTRWCWQIQTRELHRRLGLLRLTTSAQGGFPAKPGLQAAKLRLLVASCSFLLLLAMASTLLAMASP